MDVKKLEKAVKASTQSSWDPDTQLTPEVAGWGERQHHMTGDGNILIALPYKCRQDFSEGGVEFLQMVSMEGASRKTNPSVVGRV
jgi:hypothetical protein